MARYSRRSSFNKNQKGIERARKHIEEAERLTGELGGTDKDVKAYFFGLPKTALRAILDEYESSHGRSARVYAEDALPHWRSGRRHMSGLVAGRLFALLPHHMPLERKYALVKTLWESKCPTSLVTFYLGPDADPREVCAVVRDQLSRTVEEYTIPEAIVNRFRWLAQADVKVQQQLHNYFLRLTRDALSLAVDERLPMLLQAINRQDSIDRKITQELIVGNHRVVLKYDAAARGISTIAPQSSTQSSNDSPALGCLVVVGIVILLIILANAR